MLPRTAAFSSSIALALACASCQLVDPESGLSGGGGSDGGNPDAIADGACEKSAYCDDFGRDVAIPAGDPVWSTVLCDPGASLAVSGGFLRVAYPANDGQAVASCYLLTNPT